MKSIPADEYRPWITMMRWSLTLVLHQKNGSLDSSIAWVISEMDKALSQSNLSYYNLMKMMEGYAIALSLDGKTVGATKVELKLKMRDHAILFPEVAVIPTRTFFDPDQTAAQSALDEVDYVPVDFIWEFDEPSGYSAFLRKKLDRPLRVYEFWAAKIQHSEKAVPIHFFMSAFERHTKKVYEDLRQEVQSSNNFSEKPVDHLLVMNLIWEELHYGRESLSLTREAVLSKEKIKTINLLAIEAKLNRLGYEKGKIKSDLLKMIQKIEDIFKFNPLLTLNELREKIHGEWVASRKN